MQFQWGYLRRVIGLTQLTVMIFTGFASGTQNPEIFLSPQESYLRGQSVLEHFGLSEGSLVFPPIPHKLQSEAGLRRWLSLMDPKGYFAPYFTLEDGWLRVFRDPGMKQVLDFEVQLLGSRSGAPIEPLETEVPAFHRHILNAQLNAADQPLKGLKVAIDPGHMGGKLWDDRTGKFVRDRRGRILSEGLIALQTALLLEQKLRSWGAEVVLTRRTMDPVTSEVFETMHLLPYAVTEVRDSIQEPWFQRLLESGPAGSAQLMTAVARNSQWKKYFEESDFNRSHYFILREDLRARSEVIQNSDADLALVIHYDTSDPPGNPTGVNPERRNGTKVYVNGSYSQDEFSSREQRNLFTHALTDGVSSEASLVLGRSVVNSLSRNLDVPLEKFSGGGNSTFVEPGIFSRNLGVSRRVTHRALTYVECLFYNDPVEFERFMELAGTVEIGGKQVAYSTRVKQVSDALAEGVQKFVSEYGK